MHGISNFVSKHFFVYFYRSKVSTRRPTKRFAPTLRYRRWKRRNRPRRRGGTAPSSPFPSAKIASNKRKSPSSRPSRESKHKHFHLALILLSSSLYTSIRVFVVYCIDPMYFIYVMWVHQYKSNKILCIDHNFVVV